MDISVKTKGTCPTYPPRTLSLFTSEKKMKRKKIEHLLACPKKKHVCIRLIAPASRSKIAQPYIEAVCLEVATRLGFDIKCQFRSFAFRNVRHFIHTVDK